MTLLQNYKTLLPDGILLGQLALRRSLAWEKAGLIFVHIPKNGGTSINTALYGRFMGHFRIVDIERTRPRLLKTLPSLAVSRNPWARAYSAYNFARRPPSANPKVQIQHPEHYQCPEFESFERFVLEWLPSRDLNREDYVFRPQMHFIQNKQQKPGVTKLGKIEDPASYQPFLEEALGRRIEIGHLNQSTGRADYRDAYTDEMRDTLSRCYSIDIGAFGYDF